ncbi:DUF5684 domain-containing protein [Leucobacter tenebrionis]|uniref:DUF5684 domain-containing protein n=1 Tax=Leucobacter tenebrionis TaxID=2873270 RepID=UPI001CA7AC56|nr:DUF5684 domain-containing protein [Leucobacter tenebrionis]QZY51127.1 DUF5684 domain-containing protein [Leucobacter tenebrionis]
MPSTHLSLDVLPIIGMTYTPAPFFGPAVMLAMLVGLFFAIAFYIWYLWSLSVLFPRIGLPSTHGWIPVWNQWQLVQRGGLPGWLVLFGLIPGLSLVAYIVSVIAIHRLNAEHGKGGGYTVLGALLPPVWAMVLTSAIDAERPGAGYDPAAYPAQGGYAAPGEYAAPAPMYAPPQPVAPQPGYQPGAEQAGPQAIPEAGSQAFPEPVQPWQQPGEPQRFAPAPDVPQAGAPSVGEPQPPQPGDEWGFSRTTAGHYERLAQEDFQRRQPPLLGAEEPARPFAWPSIEESNPRPVPAAPPAADTPPASSAPPAPAAPQQAPPVVLPPVVAPEPPAAGQEFDSQESFSTVRPSIFDSNPEQSTDPAPRAAAAHRAEEEPAEDALGETVDAPAASAGTVFTESATDAANEEDLDRTVVVPRRSRWGLELPDGEVLELRGDDIVVGRKPQPRNGSAVLQIVDPTRTLSKSHARLRRVDETWTIEDLDSTNGVALVDEHGDQIPLEVNREAPVTERLVIGTLEVTLRRLG